MSPDRLVRRLNGPRGSALLFLALFAATHALAYSPLVTPPFQLPAGLAVVSQVIPIHVYAVLWAVVAVVAVLGAWTDTNGDQRLVADRAAWSGIVGLIVVWGLSYLVGYALFLGEIRGAEGAGRSYVFAGMYMTIAPVFALTARAMPNAQTYRPEPARRPKR